VLQVRGQGNPLQPGRGAVATAQQAVEVELALLARLDQQGAATAQEHREEPAERRATR
jgi:hypothetical protein